jgi:cell wall-associated NlpC family hydrolase
VDRAPQRPAQTAQRPVRAAQRPGHGSRTGKVVRTAGLVDETTVGRSARRPEATVARSAKLATRSVRLRQGRHARVGVARRVVTRYAPVAHSQRVVQMRGGMSAVIAFARSQIGKSYVTGGTGAGGFDCSGLTARAYARAGIALPHSSRAQAARAAGVSRSSARPGDLVIGPGHVGIYMGNGMMIDAGNHRTGVVYRKMYGGLRIGRL